jgi:hypothetical protein
VLKTTRMPAVLLEAGSIINRDEELMMDSAERRNVISGAVTAALKKFCDPHFVTPESPSAGADGAARTLALMPADL